MFMDTYVFIYIYTYIHNICIVYIICIYIYIISKRSQWSTPQTLWHSISASNYSHHVNKNAWTRTEFFHFFDQKDLAAILCVSPGESSNQMESFSRQSHKIGVRLNGPRLVQWLSYQKLEWTKRTGASYPTGYHGHVSTCRDKMKQMAQAEACSNKFHTEKYWTCLWLVPVSHPASCAHSF